MSACKFIEKILKDRVHCPTCDHDYEIIQFDHTCPGTSRCGPKGKSIVERYVEKLTPEQIQKQPQISIDDLEGLTDDILEELIVEAPLAECNNCEKARKERTTARKATCPDCNYNGYYVHDGDKLCPSCKHIRENPPPVKERKTKPPKHTVNTEVNTPPPKKNLTLHLDIGTTGNIPSEGSLAYVKLTGTTDGDEPFEFSQEIFIECEDNYDYQQHVRKQPNTLNYVRPHIVNRKDAMMHIHNIIYAVKEFHNFQWYTTSDLKFKWLEYTYNKYGHDGRISLKP